MSSTSVVELILKMIIPCLIMVTLLSSYACDGLQTLSPSPYNQVVEIRNNLEGNVELKVHCKSKDDDLGIRVLNFNETFTFTFLRNFWQTTLFFCGFRWENEFHWFDVFTPDTPTCVYPTPCLWFVIASGPCKIEYGSGPLFSCYPWNKDSLRSKMIESKLFPQSPTSTTTAPTPY
ncbi:hypothetical protein F8388_026612 [Cannabis sativa]|uniref:S-protein homolog n=1 Tax=Cannabis sativa TaxID=3483 RepID=A0A7J6EAI9_CANSA|nr:hypothetical protein F8388_026612 [Cannabis sativa]